MSDSKSGFEIRADLLSQAQGLLEQNAQRELDAAYFAIDQAGDETTLISLPGHYLVLVIKSILFANDFCSSG